MDLGLIYFASEALSTEPDPYRFLMASAAFADAAAFSTLWVPERHFTPEGAPYPNPALIHAALAQVTRRIRLRAGSVVAPLHSALRISEEWAAVDRLSQGRVGLSFASGWNPADFALAPERYADRQQIMLSTLDQVRRLWRGEAIVFRDGTDKPVSIQTYPRPVQPELPFGLTAAGSLSTFQLAGSLGGDILTHAFNLTLPELGERIAAYRLARAASGHDPATGRVAVMLHTLVTPNSTEALKLARPALARYLASASSLLGAIATHRGQQVNIDALSLAERLEYAHVVADRLIDGGRVLFGSPEQCAAQLRSLRRLGVDEIACQLDFGVDVEQALASLRSLSDLRDLASSLGAIRSGKPCATQPVADERSLLAATARCSQHVDLDAFYGELESRGVRLGVPFRTLRQVARGEHEAVARVALANPDEHEGQLLLLDGCLQTLAAAVPEGRLLAASYLPAGFAVLNVPAELPNEVSCHAELDPTDSDAPAQLTGSLRIFEPNGALLGFAEGVRLKRVTAALEVALPLADCEYEIEWLEAGFPLSEPQQRPVLMVGTASPMADALSQALRARGLVVHELRSYLELANELMTSGTVRHSELDLVLLPWESEQESSPLEAYDRAMAGGLVQTLTLARALIASSQELRLWQLTRGAMSVTGQERMDPLQAMSWGFVRAFSQENPQIACGLIDLDPETSAVLAAERLAALFGTATPGQGALRDDRYYVPRICTRQERSEQRYRWRDDRPYLLSGGLGGLAIAVAQFAVRKGARHLILLHRRSSSELDSEAASVVRELEGLGARVDLHCVDLADVAAVDTFCRAYTGSAIAGVFHLAGIGNGQVVSGLDASLMDQAARAKVLGALSLSAALSEQPLDFFVSFSSPASTLGLFSEGGANYAAASAFLDVFAASQRRRGIRGISIGWGPWAEIGLAHRSGKIDRLAQRGILAMERAECLDTLERLLAEAPEHRLVARFDWGVAADTALSLSDRALLGSLVEPRPGSRTQPPERPALSQLMALPSSSRPAAVTELLAEIVAGILGTPASELDYRVQLGELGLDSLMAVDLRAAVQRELGVTLSFALLLDGASLERLSAWTLNTLQAEADLEDEQSTTATLLSAFDTMSSDDVSTLIDWRPGSGSES